MSAFQSTSIKPEMTWSGYIESTRKDIERVFGIMKKRFRCLKNVILLKRQADINNMFVTCCILHNMLLSVVNVNIDINEFDALNSTEENEDLIPLHINNRSKKCNTNTNTNITSNDNNGNDHSGIGRVGFTNQIRPILSNNVSNNVSDSPLEFNSFRNKLLIHYNWINNKNNL